MEGIEGGGGEGTFATCTESVEDELTPRIWASVCVCVCVSGYFNAVCVRLLCVWVCEYIYVNMFYLLFMYGVTIVRGRRSSIRQLFRRFAFVCVCVCVLCVLCVCVCVTTRVPSPTSILPVFGSASKKKKIYFELIKNLVSASSYFLTALLIQNLLPFP